MRFCVQISAVMVGKRVVIASKLAPGVSDVLEGVNDVLMVCECCA